MSTQTAAVLDAARDLLDREGWRQGHRGNIPGRCALVAIGAADAAHASAHGVPTRYMAAAQALASVVGDESTTIGGQVTDWNDAPGRRVSEVLDAFTAAAAREREAG
jgi:hypothetical protein